MKYEYTLDEILLANMSQNHRDVLVARIHGHSYGSIASMFNIPKGTVKSRLNRARMVMTKQALLMEGVKRNG